MLFLLLLFFFLLVVLLFAALILVLVRLGGAVVLLVVVVVGLLTKCGARGEAPPINLFPASAKRKEQIIFESMMK